MKTVVWSDESISSIQTIYDFVYLQSPQNAEVIVETIFELGSKLNIFPEGNPIDPFYNSDTIRFFQNGITKFFIA